MIEVLSGVDEGDEVVIGSYRAISTDIKNGAKITVNNDADADSGNS